MVVAPTRGEIWDAGKYKETDSDIIERFPDGSTQVRFRTVPAIETAGHMAALERLPREFTVVQLEQACPGVSREMVRRMLGSQKGKSVQCIGRGPDARWTKIAATEKG